MDNSWRRLLSLGRNPESRPFFNTLQQKPSRHFLLVRLKTYPSNNVHVLSPRNHTVKHNMITVSAGFLREERKAWGPIVVSRKDV